MGRAQRVDFEGAIHHVMNRGVNHQPVFFGDDDRIEFGRLLAEIHGRFGVETLAYCLMDNHFHLVLRTPEAQLAGAMRHLTANYTKRVNRRLHRDGPLFRGRYRSIVVSTDHYLGSAVRYVHRNPLDIPSVIRSTDYRWTSYPTYLDLRPCPTFVNADIVLSLFDFDRASLATFTEAPRPWLDVRGAVALDDVTAFVEFVVARDDTLFVRDGEPTPPSQCRTILLLIMDTLGDCSIASAIDRQLAFPTPSARRKAIARARRRLETDPATARSFNYAVSELGVEPARMSPAPFRRAC